MISSRAILIAALAGTALVAAPVGAQDIRVRFVDQETRQPLAGLLVAALADDNAVGPAVLSTADGIATVRLPGTGQYRLYIRRIGFAPVTTAPVAVPAEPGQPVEIVVPAHRIVLGTVHVMANVTCAPRTASPSAEAEPAWADVRTALEASALTRDQRLVTTAALRFERQLRLDGTVDYADTTVRGRSGERPFVAPPPAALERDGYFRRHDDGSEEFFAPDEAVLLSSGFTRAHCINASSIVRHDSAGGVANTLMALSFIPRDHDTRAEIKGIIWIDSATNELRRIDFEYVRTVLPAPADSLGGSVTFQHLTTGAWIVSNWLLRIPRWRVVRTNYVVLDGYLEVGGTASVVRDLATPGPNVPRIITGTVFDSVAQRPLSGAHVHLADLGREAIADSVGRFRFDSVTPGVHAVWADHASLDAMGLYSLGASVNATPQVTSDIALAVPSFATLWRRGCGAAATAGDGDGFVFGTVRVDSADTSRFARDPATIVVAWHADTAGYAHAPADESRLRASTDSLGNYAVCGVPAAATLTLTATRAGGSGTRPVSVALGAARMARRDLSLMSPAALAAAIADAERGKGGSNAHRLRVLSADGSPIAYANVSLNGGIPVITNNFGEVGLGAARIHASAASVRRIGFSPWFGTVDFPDTTSVVTVSLVAAGQRLGDVRITAKANPSSPFVQGFYDRWMMRQKGLLSATFIGPEELEFRHPDRITNMLRGLNGAHLVQWGTHEYYAVANDTPNCLMAIVVDGIQIYPQTDARTGRLLMPVLIDQIVPPASEIMGIEVYARGGNMPISLQVNDSRCGVIAFWTGSRR